MRKLKLTFIAVLAPVLSAALLAAIISLSTAPLDGAATGAAASLTPAAASPRGDLRVYPPQVNLDGAGAHQSIVVQLTRPDGATLDVTSQSHLAIAADGVAKVSGNIVSGVADGQTQLNVSFDGQVASAPLMVKNAAVHRPISFNLDVMPVFTRSGCNVGGCHGAASGRDGFRLSLFGFDPAGDYYRLTREQPTRRINLAEPAQSLLMLKAVGKVPHTGGSRFHEDSQYYATLMTWLKAGAPKDPPTVAKPIALDLYPPQTVLEGQGAHQQLTAVATYSDGTHRDVSSLVFFFGNNESSATVTPDGLITAGQRGEAFITARFATFTVGVPIIVIPRDVAYHFPPVKDVNYIDTLVDVKLKKLRIVPSEICTDEEYLRRVYIDVIGLLPTRDEYDRFISNPDPDKRAHLVDELLTRKEFVDLWVMKWAELLEIRSNSGNRFGYKATLLYFDWLEQKIENNVPIDQIVRELLSASGGTFKNPATNYYQVETQTLKLSENTAQVFMGMRIQCAQCHNHPFDRWTMDDYYSFAAFFSQIGRKPGEDPRETIVSNSGGGDVRQPISGQIMKPKFLGGEVPDCTGKDRRQVLAQWLTSDQNPYFAKNVANIVWAQFFGRGIVDPVDEARVTNPPSNAQLLDALGQHLISYRYDMRRLVHDICTSRTYQLSTRTNSTNQLDESNFSHGRVRRLRAEVMLDCISEVTQTRDKFRGLPLGSKAVEIADGATTNYFLTTFGRATRETVCSCEVKMEPNLSQALHLLNGDTLSRKISQGDVTRKMVAAKMPFDAIVTDLYIRCTSRRPMAAELQRIHAALGDSVKTPQQEQQALDDVFWALLNGNEFMFNH